MHATPSRTKISQCVALRMCACKLHAAPFFSVRPCPCALIRGPSCADQIRLPTVIGPDFQLTKNHNELWSVRGQSACKSIAMAWLHRAKDAIPGAQLACA